MRYLGRTTLGYCRIQSCHALNDRGVDILLSAEGFKAGFQIKSHGDVKKDSFSGDVKRQFADSHSYGLDHYYLLICSPLFDGKKDLRPRINSLLNDVGLYRNVAFTPLAPTNIVKIFKEPAPMSRDELLARGAISSDCLYEHEKGYEHLPDIYDDEIEAAQSRLNEFGSDLYDSEGGLEAIQAYDQLIHEKQAAQFMNTFASTLPPYIQEKRAALILGIQSLLAECRKNEHWRSKEEDIVQSRFLGGVPEEMIPYTSIPNLLQAHKKLSAELLFLENLSRKHSRRSQRAETGG